MADIKKYNGSTWEHSLRKLTTATEAVENPLYSDGIAITNYTISGNTVQNGTPTPSNPVDANGVGELTDNLANGFSWGYYAYTDGSLSTLDRGWVHTDKIPCKASTKYTGSSDIVEGSRWIGFVFWDSNGDYISTSNQQKSQPYPTSISLTVTTPSNAAYMAMNVAGAVAQRQIPLDTVTNFQVTESETVLPYEPYGYKIPISSGGVTTNIYLGSTQSTRQIKKYVFDGTQSIYSCVRTTDSQNYCCAFRFSDIGMTDIKDYDVAMSGIDYPIFISDRFVNKDSSKRAYYNNVSAGEMGANNTAGGNRYVIFCVSGLTTAEEYTDWFTNNPTTLYYILETPTTGIVNEPLMKIGTYADTLSNVAQIPTTEGANSITVDTTVQPSEFTATWTGWHDASVKEWDGSQWNE